MTTLWLTPQIAQAICQHVTEQLPIEACGFVVGEHKRPTRIIPITNIAKNPQHAFYMNPAETLAAFRQIEHNQEQLLAIYHSHPKTAPIPSSDDIAQWQFPDTIALIISAQYVQPQLAAWCIYYHSVTRAELVISPHQPIINDSQSLSRPQQLAIILSAILAIICFLAIALALLPPAPPLPAFIS